MKKQNGITLIALVITIIVLLILAGVSIAMLTGDNGILTKARNATSATDLAEALERVNLELNAQLANAMSGSAFDAQADIQANVSTMPDGYTATATVTSSDSYSTSNTVTIKLAGPEGVTITPAAGGTVKYDSTDKVWEVTPVEGSVNE